MENILLDYIDGFTFTGNIFKDSFELLRFHNQEEVALHCLKVTEEARKIADRFGMNADDAELSGILHDIGRIIPEERMVEAAHQLNIEVLEEESIHSGSLHPKLSKVIANQVFNINNNAILSAIECHSTLKHNASKEDMLLLIADKVSWDSKYNQRFIDAVNRGLDKSLEHGAFAYIKYLYEDRDNLTIMHPWLIDAYNYLSDFSS